MPLNGAEITFWADLSGNERHMVSPSTNGADEPLYQDNETDNLNGLPVVEVEAGDGMEMPLERWSEPWTGTGITYYWAGNYTPAQSGLGILWFAYEANFGAHAISLFLDVDEDYFDTDDPPAASVGWESSIDGLSFKYGLAAAVAGTQVLAWVFDSAAETGKIYRNGVELVLSRDDGIYDQEISLGEDFQEFAAFAAGTNCVVGRHYAFLADGEAHDAATVASVSAYLMHKLGIS